MRTHALAAQTAKELPSHARAPPPSHETTPRCLLLHTTRALTVVSGAPEDEQLVVGRREAVSISGRRTGASGIVREVGPRVVRGVQHEEVIQQEVVHKTCRSRDSGR